jgi:hypothetical protein
MMKTIALGVAIGAAVIFCGGALWNLFPGDPSLSAAWFTECVQDKVQPLSANSCHRAQARFQSNNLAVAACASHESRKIQKCHPVRDRTHDENTAGKFKSTMVNQGHIDLTISTLINYYNDWGDVQIAYYTVRLTRTSEDDIEWSVANTEFAIMDKFENLVAVP